MKYYVTENRNLKVWTEKPLRPVNAWHPEVRAYNEKLEDWQTAFDNQDEILTSPELKEQLTPGQVIEEGKDFRLINQYWPSLELNPSGEMLIKDMGGGRKECFAWVAVPVPLDTATEESNLREAEIEAIKRYPNFKYEGIMGPVSAQRAQQQIELRRKDFIAGAAWEAARKALATPTDKFTRQDMEGLTSEEWAKAQLMLMEENNALKEEIKELKSVIYCHKQSHDDH